MKNKIRILTKYSIAIISLAFFYACNKISDSITTEKEGQEIVLKVQADIIGFTNKDVTASQNAEVERKSLDTTIALNKDYFFKAILKPINEEKIGTSSNIIKQKGENKAATNPINTNVWYKLVIFNKETGDYVADREYQKGKELATSSLVLEAWKEYTFVAYSVNSTNKEDLPTLGGPATGKNVSNCYIDIEDNNIDLLYFKADKFLSEKAGDYLNIVFNHMFNQITVKVDAEDTGYTIGSLTANLTTTSSSVRINFANGLPVRSGGTSTIPLTFTGIGTSIASSTVVINSGNLSTLQNLLSISAINIGDITVSATKNYFPEAVLIPGQKYELTISVVPEDEYIDNYGELGINAVRINGQVWMRHNLRSDGDYSANPDIASPNIFGNYYQWGRLTPVSSERIIETSPPSNWLTQANTYANSWNGNTSTSVTVRENAPTKATNSSNAGGTGDPCPNGYRVPTHQELEHLASNNSTKFSFDGTLSNGSDSGIGVLTSLRNSTIRMTIPLQGSLFAVDGGNGYAGIDNKGLIGRFWSSYYDYSSSYINSHLSIQYTNLSLSISKRNAASNNTSIGLPIRCIAINSSL